MGKDARVARRAAIALRIGWRLGVRWYGLTQELTDQRGRPVEPAHDEQQIVIRLGGGQRYKRDPWKGRLDVLRHPRRVQRWIDEGRPVGDCDDHAGYWLACLLKSGLAAEAWLGLVYMQNPEGKISGHAVALYRREPSGPIHWADYAMPHEAGAGPWAWALQVGEAFGARPVFAGMAKVDRLEPDDTLVLRPVDGQRFR